MLEYSSDFARSDTDFRGFHAVEDRNAEIPRIPGSDKVEETVSELEENVIKDIVKFPYSGVVERYKRLGLSRRKGNACKKSLVSKGILETERICDGNRILVMLKLTNKGKELARRVGERIKGSPRNGGMEHKYWKNKLAEHFKAKGWKVTTEYLIGGGKTIDLLIEKEGKRIPVEIETGTTDPRYNIQKDIEAGFDYVIIAATGREALAKTQSKITKSDKVRIVECGLFTSEACQGR
jgi:hypothetical protein